MSPASLSLYVDARCVSPYALSVYVTLVEKGLAFETRDVDLGAREHQRPDYLSRSLTGRVPTLVHQDFALAESSAITEYLEEAFPPPTYAAVYPRNIRDRARARQIQAWLRSDLDALRAERPTTSVFIAPIDTPLSDAGRAAADKLIRTADALLGEKSLSLFEDWCIADTDLAVMLNRLARNGDPLPEKLATYARHQWQRPSVAQWVQRERR
jgi:glutathione S-transferase